LTTGITAFSQNAEWSKDYEPFRIAGNLYYVGTYDLGCFLITTPEGHILINTGLAESAPMIQKHVEALGFTFNDIKILLTTQAHFDHVAAMAEIKKLTGASFMVDEGDAAVMADGGSSDYAFGGNGKMFNEVRPDKILRDGDTIRLGDVRLVMLHHPGHTKGSSSYLLDVKDSNRTYRVLIANMPSVVADIQKAQKTNYPSIIKDYDYTFAAMKKIKFDIWVASHASQFGLHKKRKPGDGYHPELFMNRNEYDSSLHGLEEYYLQRRSK
jgi:metallo-beta-lactamase class B